jgi:glycerophosphoryl diester phosphodiesterase
MRRLRALVCVVTLVLAACDSSEPDGDVVDAPEPTTGNQWRDGIVNIAHAGGIHEAPQNTLYAFKTAADRGADALEMDLHATADGEVVVIHDSTVDRTTDGSGCVVEHTLDELRDLDAAATHVDGQGPESGRPEDDYPYRGVATGTQSAPDGFADDDFRIPTLEEVFEAVPHMPMVLEIKPTQVDERDGVEHDCPAVVEAMDPEERPDLVAELARLIDVHDMTDQVLVASFVDELLHRFAEIAPDVATSFPEREGLAFFAAWSDGEAPTNPYGHAAIQPPIDVALGIGGDVVEDFVEYLHDEDIAVQVWTVNDEATMLEVLAWGADGIITDRVRLLHDLVG